MARCLNCIHFDVCDIDKRRCEECWGDCSDFLNDNDVVPRSEVDWHREAELNAQRIIELEAEKDALIKNYSECIKEFADRLKASRVKPEFPWDDFFVTESTIDDLVKEMTEEKK